jgi:hypothetical protein
MQLCRALLRATLVFSLAGCATTRPAASTPTNNATKPAATERPILAVFDLEAKGVALDAETLERLSDYLTVVLVESSAFKVVPREQLTERLRAQKKTSYRSCYDQQCQIEIGRELAASKSLATRVVRLGTSCTVVSSLYDLKTATAETAARARGPCDEEAIAAMLIPVVARISGKDATAFAASDGSGAAGEEAAVGGRAKRRPRSIKLDCKDCLFAVDEDPEFARKHGTRRSRRTTSRNESSWRKFKSKYQTYKAKYRNPR